MTRFADCACCESWKFAVCSSLSLSSSLSRRSCIVLALINARVASPSA
nr:MAG TPA: hypothetical protein [Caudoviricetes sp.]